MRPVEARNVRLPWRRESDTEISKQCFQCDHQKIDTESGITPVGTHRSGNQSVPNAVPDC